MKRVLLTLAIASGLIINNIEATNLTENALEQVKRNWDFFAEQLLLHPQKQAIFDKMPDTLFKMYVRLLAGEIKNETTKLKLDIDLAEIKEEIKDAKKTTELYLIGSLKELSNKHINYIVTLLPRLLPDLTILDLSLNKLTNIHYMIGDLVDLRKLYLDYNNLTKLPDTLGNLVDLRKLYLDHNKLKNIPDTLSNLVNLKLLYLQENPVQLKDLPDSIKNLEKLTHLYT
jgi:Leucine-rich repeat (LRR) protein